jgi:hypothetical protein
MKFFSASAAIATAIGLSGNAPIVKGEGVGHQHNHDK